MVETQEELSKRILEPKKAKTLFGIIARYVQDGYKQFEWDVSIYDNKKFPSDAWNVAVRMKTTSGGRDIIIGLSSTFNKIHGIESPIIDAAAVTRQTFKIQDIVKSPPNSPTPQDLAKLAKVIFAWIKGEMKKIP